MDWGAWRWHVEHPGTMDPTERAITDGSEHSAVDPIRVMSRETLCGVLGSHRHHAR